MQKKNDLKTWWILFLSLLIYSCGNQDDLIGKKILASYSGPELKIPLPAGYKWGINVPVGGRFGPEPDDVDHYHMGNGYYSIDFDDDIEGDGQGDLSADNKTVDILAAADGVVSFIENTNCVEGSSTCPPPPGRLPCSINITHTNGYITKYLHLVKGSIVVNIGDQVKQGQKLGVMGNTGPSCGVHLHFQIQHDDGMGTRNSAQNNPNLSGVTLETVTWDNFLVGQYYLSNNSFHFDPNDDVNNPYFCYNRPVFNGAGYSCNGWDNFEPGNYVWFLMYLDQPRKDVCFKTKWYVGTREKYESSEACSNGIEQRGGIGKIYYPTTLYPTEGGTWEARVYVRLKQNTDYLDVPIVKKNFTVLTPTSIPNTPTILRLISPNFPQTVESTGDPVIIEWTRMDNTFWYKLYLWLYYNDTGWEMSGGVNYIYGLNAVRIGGAAPRTYGAWAVKACNQLGCSPLSRIGFYFYDP